MLSFLPSLAGGAAIGFSAVLLLVLNGRIAGISGIVGGLFSGIDTRLLTNAAFVIGMLLGPLLFLTRFGAWPVVRFETPLPLLGIAGLLVGFGTRLGSGCTSGHGILGLARLSPRSMVAVAVFLSMATVYFMRVSGVG